MKLRTKLNKPQGNALMSKIGHLFLKKELEKKFYIKIKKNQADWKFGRDEIIEEIWFGTKEDVAYAEEEQKDKNKKP